MLQFRTRRSLVNPSAAGRVNAGEPKNSSGYRVPKFGSRLHGLLGQRHSGLFSHPCVIAMSLPVASENWEVWLHCIGEALMTGNVNPLRNA